MLTSLANRRAGQSEGRVSPTPIRTPEWSSLPHGTTKHERHLLVSVQKAVFSLINVKRSIQRRRRQAWTTWKNSESSSSGAAYHRLQHEQHRSRRILRAERFSFEWKLANSAKIAPKFYFAHVNGNKRMTARILQLHHPSGSLINSDQEMTELLKTTYLGFFREDEGSTPVLRPRTQTCMADPLITEH